MSRYATEKQLEQMFIDYRSAATKLIACDYDGVLSELKDDTSADASRPTPETLELLKNIATQPNTTLAIITGRKKEDVDGWLKELPEIYLSAEHGGWKRTEGKWQQQVNPDPKQIEAIVTAMIPYTKRVPGSKIETKSFGVVWHFRTADQTKAQKALPDIQKVLGEITRGTQMGVYVSTSGGNIVEVKPKDMNKGSVMKSLINSVKPDFIMCLGDDYTDEHMFEVCPPHSYTIRVRGGDTIAKMSIAGVSDVFKILHNITSK